MLRKKPARHSHENQAARHAVSQILKDLEHNPENYETRDMDVDDEIQLETLDDKFRRYQGIPLAEASDPEFLQRAHHFTNPSETSEEEDMSRPSTMAASSNDRVETSELCMEMTFVRKAVQIIFTRTNQRTYS